MIITNLQEFYQTIVQDKPLISIDYGGKKCGIAISNPALTIALPLLVIHKIQIKEKIEAILELVNKHAVGGIVIGLPIDMDGSVGMQASIVMKFAANLAQCTATAIYLQDERFTSKAADSMLKSIGLNRKQRNSRDDTTAASLILETILELRRYYLGSVPGG